MRGSEGSIFPPFKDKEESIWAFEAGICRSMRTVYKGKSRYGGLPTSRHIIEFGDLAADETQHCYCNDGECPPKGTIDLFPCLGSPIIGSMPHFLDADTALSSNVASGMTPDRVKHSVFLDMEAVRKMCVSLLIMNYKVFIIDIWHSVTRVQTYAIEYGNAASRRYLLYARFTRDVVPFYVGRRRGESK